MATLLPSRPGTQSSIQSSNSGILNHIPPIQDNEIQIYEKNDLEFTKIINPLDTSPLFLEFHGDFDHLRNDNNRLVRVEDEEIYYDSEFGHGSDALTHELNFRNFLNELPSSCIPFAFYKLSTAEFNSLNGPKSPDEYSQYTSSSKLSPHLTFNYNELSPLSKLAYNRKKIVEEIIDTEESYISCLKMLGGIYLESIIQRGNNGIPIKLLLDYTNLLIASHEEFLTDLNQLFQASIKNIKHSETNEITKHLISPTSTFMSALVAGLINEKAISIYIYQEYYSLVDLVLKLIDSKQNDPELGETLTRGFQKFLESSTDEKLDLSLSSLIYKPIQRISKYKLFLDNLLKTTPIEEDELSNKKINDCVVQIDYSIKEINRYGLQEKIKSITLFNNLNFCKSLKFPVEYLGLPLLLGSTNVSYVSDENLTLKSTNYGAFLFKTHLILANVSNFKQNKFDVVFLIPLSVSKIITLDEVEYNGGIYTDYSNSFKILFEHQFKKYELLFSNFNDHENSIWKEKLLILIDVVNGPYKLDYSSSQFNEDQGTTSSTIIPTDIQSYDLKLDKIINFNKKKSSVFSNCYFQKVIPIQVKIENIDSESIYYQYYTTRRLKNANNSNHMSTCTVYLKQIERTKIEFILEDLWSDELVSPNSIMLRGQYKKKNSSKKSAKESNHSKKDLLLKTSQCNGSLRSMLKDDPLKSNSNSIRMSIMRRTSVIFGDALRSIFSSTDS